MKYVGWATAGLLLVVLVLASLQQLAAERVEVVEVHAADETGEMVTTRLWIVDHEGDMYLRVGADGSGWYTRLQANPSFTMTRGDETKAYRAVSKPAMSDVINDLMQAKYTWGDSFIGALVGSREGSIPILLEPLDTEPVGP
ncbi:MAG: hypothetical protein ACE37D_01045 [Pseudomonadales bacterium]